VPVIWAGSSDRLSFPFDVTLTEWNGSSRSVPAGCVNYGQWWTIPPGPGWHQRTCSLDNARFVNKWGWHFAFQNETSGDFWIEDGRLSKIVSPAR
jgi:hypothetical protein